MLTAAALTALPLAWRRLYPITAWLVIIAAIAIVQQDFVPKVALGTAVYAAYSAIAYSRYRNLAIAAVSLTTVAAAAEFGARFPQFQFPGRLTAIFVVLPAAAAGLGIRELRRRLADSTARLRRAGAEAAAATERALAAERARIAAELHNVVTHNVSVMIVQAGAARKILASSRPTRKPRCSPSRRQAVMRWQSCGTCWACSVRSPTAGKPGPPVRGRAPRTAPERSCRSRGSASLMR